MDSGNVIIDSDMAYPILFMPKKCTTLETNSELSDNVYIDVNITFPDREGNETSIYSGLCSIKLVDSYDVNLNREETPESSTEELGIGQMPVILSETNQQFLPYNQSQVWIDPSRSPYVYNHYDPSTQEQYSIRESGGLITVEQHNTYITQNVYNCRESNVFNFKECSQSPVMESECKRYRKVQETGSMGHMDINQSWRDYEEDEFECGVFLSQLSEEIMNEEQTRAKEERKVVHQESNALKQLMSSDIQSTSKQRKTILFQGQDSHSGQTIQNIFYNDPLVKCAEMEVDNEVVIEASTSNPIKKRYQCDKCKQIFDRISSFRKHMVGNHTNKTATNFKYREKELCFMCKKCGKNLKNRQKFELHCLGHGDPDLECSKCRKVFASKFSLRVHMKIHSRKYPCAYCIKTYDNFEVLRTHMERIHFVYMCHDENCTFVSRTTADLRHHEHLNKTEVLDNDDIDDPIEEIDSKSEVGQDFKLGQESNDFSRSEVERPNHNLTGSNQVLSGSSESLGDLELGSEELTPSLEDKEGERIRKADSVIAKIMSNKVFLLSSKKAKRQRCRKTCEVCLKPFLRIDDLKRHLIEHVIKSTLEKTPLTGAGGLNMTCEVCQTETFNKIDKYKAHLREHAKLTLYKCTFCDKSFSDSSNFSKHKKTHGISYLQCDLCNRKFNSKKMITQHMDMHNKTTPVKCNYCDRFFHFQSMLNKHMRYTHKKEECTKYRCRFCDEIFGSLKEKWDHEWNVHNVRKNIVDCLICGSQYRKYSELKRHCLNEHEMHIPPLQKLMKKRYSRRSF